MAPTAPSPAVLRSEWAPDIGLLRRHGDADVRIAGADVVDLAVNVRPGGPPAWLSERVAGADLSRYPDTSAARVAVAARHGRSADQVLLTAGAAEAFVLVARSLRPKRAVVVHPQFTEPELALTAAGHPVQRLVLPPPFRLDPDAVPDDADLVVIGNPTNPTSVLHPAHVLRALARPGRVLVVDEAFADCVRGEPESLATATDVPGLIVVRSLTKTWSIPGLRAGYLLAEAQLVEALGAAQPPWPVSAGAVAAFLACADAEAVRHSDLWAAELAADRAELLALLADVPGVEVNADPAASFVLLHVADGELVRAELLARGFAVRRGDTFPGLGPDWLRVAVRDPATSRSFVTSLKESMCPTSTR